MEILGKGPEVPYETCVMTITGAPPEPSRPEEKRRRVADLLASAGHPSSGADSLLAAVDAWRKERLVPGKSIPALGDAFIAQLRRARRARTSFRTCRGSSRASRGRTSKFLAIENAWFSGSMNYLGHARRTDGSPEYEATYELNAVAPDLRPRVPAARQPRGRARPRHDVRVPAGPLRARARRLRGVGPHDEHARGRPLRGHREQRRPDRARRHGGRRASRPRTFRSASSSRSCRTTRRTTPRT